MAKTLKISFSGICTFAPGVPPNPATEFEKLFAVMPAARQPKLTKDTKGIVSRHHAYVYVPQKNLQDSSGAALSITKKVNNVDVVSNVYLVDHARITLDTVPNNKVKYFQDPTKPVKGHHSDPGVAPPKDSRWVPDTREIFGSVVKLKVNPKNNVSDVVSMVVELSGGSIESDHACNSSQKRKFEPEIAVVEERIMNPDTVVIMEFPDATTTVTLKASKLDPGNQLIGLPATGLVLVWGGSQEIVIRMGNDTLDEIVIVDTNRRCAATPVDRRDNDFDLHYEILDIPANSVRPIPVFGGGHGDFGGCVGLRAELP